MLKRAEEEEEVSDDSRKLGPVRFGPRAHTLCATNHKVEWYHTSFTIDKLSSGGTLHLIQFHTDMHVVNRLIRQQMITSQQGPTKPMTV